MSLACKMRVILRVKPANVGGNVAEIHERYNENQHTNKKNTFENSIFEVIFLSITTRLICKLP